VKTHFENHARPKTQRLTDLENKAAELERRLSDARESLDRELAHYTESWDAVPGYDDELRDGPEDADYDYDAETASLLDIAPRAVNRSATGTNGHRNSAGTRTATLINQGRPSANRPAPRAFKIGAVAVVAAALAIGLAVVMMPGHGPTWPASVARVQSEVNQACQNPDVSSEPGQVNFACGKATRQILWVFALLTSGNDPRFAQAGTGREGLEPITPQQGGVLAWSLNLHHPYNPTDPIDSLAVAARAINNIVGGATVTGTYGKPVVQQGLEGHAANCLRYTGSAKVSSHKGFPDLCTKPVSSPAGQAALVSDIYQRWVVGASPKAAQNAATLFANAKNPSNPQVQAILKHLPTADH
jgi:hypothetical protein